MHYGHVSPNIYPQLSPTTIRTLHALRASQCSPHLAIISLTGVGYKTQCSMESLYHEMRSAMKHKCKWIWLYPTTRIH